MRLAYYEHIGEGPGPTVTVIQDMDDHPGYGAWWGEVNTNIHQGLGSLGVITNGSIRDLPDSAQRTYGLTLSFLFACFATQTTLARSTVHVGWGVALRSTYTLVPRFGLCRFACSAATTKGRRHG